MVTKDLGLVTAYAYAVAGGYTGTEEEFQALLGNIAIDLAEIENLSVTVTTLPAGSSATASYDSGVLSLGIPKGDKGDSGDVANVAPEFSTSTPYDEGDYVIYNDLLYKFKTAKAAGAWDSTKVEAKTVGDELTALKEDIEDNIDDIITTIKSKNLLNVSALEIGRYLNPNGTYEEIANRAVTDFINVNPGDIVITSFTGGGGTQTAQLMPSICCFNNSKTVVTGGVFNTYAFTVPDNVSYIKITLTSTVYNNGTAMIEISNTTTPSDFEPYFEPISHLNNNIVIPKKNLGNYRWSGTMANGDIIRLPMTNIKNRQVYSFSANITTFDTINIGRIYPNDNTYGSFEINNTNVIFHCDNGVDYTYTHGLTIENDIQVIIETTNSPFLTVARLYSNGQMYDIFANMTQKRFIGDEGAPFVSSEGSTLYDCAFSWTSRNINKPVCLFGDSYMSMYENRWVFYLIQDGFEDSCIINARAGEKSEEALDALKNIIESVTPNYVVWCMGMNDPDENTAVNATWVRCFTEMLSICRKIGAVPILATIPNTPTMNNVYKNTIVKNSGHRYIDFAAAVGASEANSPWFEGMLDNSQSHPTVTGAKALYMRVLADFPEITTL